MRVYFTPSAQKDFKRLALIDQKKIAKKLSTLGSSPFSGKKLGGEFAGFWTIRAWPYRIIYEINDKSKRVEIHKIKHRQGAYK